MNILMLTILCQAGHTQLGNLNQELKKNLNK